MRDYRLQTMDEFERKASELLSEDVEHLDAETLSRLRQARTRALGKRQRRAIWYWPAAGALAAGLLVLVLYPEEPPPLPSIYEDPVQQAAAEDLELLEDLEFYAWLALEEEGAADGDQS